MSISPTALTELATVQAVVGSAYSTARIEQVINAVSEAVERWCGRSFAYRALTTDNPEYYRGTGRLHLYLRRWPIVTVTRVRINGSAVTDYDLVDQFKQEGCIYRSSGWPMQAAGFGDLTGDTDYGRQAYPIDVVYAAGYILPQYGGAENAEYNPDTAARNLPYDLEEAVIRATTEILSRPTSGLVSETTPGGWRRQWGSSTRQGATSSNDSLLSPEVQSLLLPYRARWFT